jgi:hypothetical protein
MKPLSPSGYPYFSAFCLNEPSDRFINFASFDTGVLAFECVFSSLMSDAVYVLRIAFFFVVFFTCACRKLNPGILVMQSAQDWATTNVPGAIDGARDRCIFLQG